MAKVGYSKAGLVAGVGFCSKDIKTRENGKEFESFTKWKSMLHRVYRSDLPRYEGVSVCEEWLDYYNFKEWYDKNYYVYRGVGRLELDKDILIKGNKYYSPETCLIVPQHINTLFTSSNKTRGVYPKGISYHKGDKKFRARISMFGITKQIGNFDNLEDAKNSYDIVRSQYIKLVAEVEKTTISTKVYNALINHHEVIKGQPQK